MRRRRLRMDWWRNRPPATVTEQSFGFMTEQQYTIARAHEAAIVDNFVWELRRALRRLLVPVLDWVAEHLLGEPPRVGPPR